mgnify:CR=1 FL=1
MTLITSISGIRGTIGGTVGDSFSPLDVVRFTAAYACWLRQRRNKKKAMVVVGRDARISGEMVQSLVAATLNASGCDVIDTGLASTPTVEMAVTDMAADGGLIITASHNPRHWNALKMLNEKGEFISADEGKQILAMVADNSYSFVLVDELGQTKKDESSMFRHIEKIVKLPLVDIEAIRSANFSIVVDAVNSVGGIIAPQLLKALGVKTIIALNCNPTGEFAHNPEPLPEHLTDLSEAVVSHKAHVGFVVDPDVDRLAIVNEDGSMFGEEYTLVAVADYVLSKTPGNTVSNMSSTMALRDVTVKRGGNYFSSKVGEVNVVECMKKNHAVIGGEGNGGVIYPVLHYGRDALVGIALFLTYLAKEKCSCSALRKRFPDYVISKNKMEIDTNADIGAIFAAIQKKYADKDINTEDGIKITFTNEWVQLRKSNTEPIVRIYAESCSAAKAQELAYSIMTEINMINNKNKTK